MNYILIEVFINLQNSKTIFKRTRQLKQHHLICFCWHNFEWVILCIAKQHQQSVPKEQDVS